MNTSRLVLLARNPLALACALGLSACLPDTTRVVTPVAIKFIAQPANTAANRLMANVTVGFLNADGAVAQNSPGGAVTLTLITSDTSVHLLGGTTADGAYGIATFYDLTVNKPATGLRMVAKSAGFDSTVSVAFDITP